MRVLVCGARGFIGRAVAERLWRAGHSVLGGVRTPMNDDEVAVDFTQSLTDEDWRTRLSGVDAVVNAAGILTERGRQRFGEVHREGPCALFRACARFGIRRVVQISALGVERGTTGYFTSKRAADDCLMAQALEWQVLRPALVYGADGGSARFFRALASLPLIPLPGGGAQRLQPVHIDDLAEAVLRLVDPATPPRQCIELVGREAVTYREMLRRYRAGMDLAPAPEVPVPAPVMALAARAAAMVPGALLTPDTWTMLQSGNTADPRATARLLGRAPRGIEDFISVREAEALRLQALASWRAPLLRLALAAVWLLTALVSVLVHPVEDSLAMLGRAGLTGAAAVAALYGAALLDLGLGAATLLRPGRRLWLLQAALVVFYCAVIAVALPEHLGHPFGPITKNLPILAILIVLFSEEPRK